MARAVNAVLHRHPALATLPDGPTPVRLRTRWSIGHAHPELGRRSLWLQLRDHRPELWVGACGLSPQEERIAPRASVVVHVDAKIDPTWAGDRHPNGVEPGVRVIGLKIQGRGPFEATMQQVLQTLDYAALAALLTPARRP